VEVARIVPVICGEPIRLTAPVTVEVARMVVGTIGTSRWIEPATVEVALIVVGVIARSTISDPLTVEAAFIVPAIAASLVTLPLVVDVAPIVVGST
jgi:hypothetical protein